MSLPIPNNRKQIYLSKIINKDLENIPIPLSRLEIYFKCLLDGDVSKLPVPISRKELILRNYILDVECDVVPVDRTEVFLKALKSVEVEGLPTPQSKLEVFLDYIIRNGCLEKYEYYPFQIRDYLNVKNTPKARMKFKGMKGNTLVNIIDNSKIGQLTYSNGWVDVLSSNNWQRSDSIPGNKKYTVIYEFILNEDITFGSDNYNQFIRVDKVSDGSVVNDSARFVGNSYKANVVNRYMFILNEAYDTKLVIRNGIQKNFKCRFFISEGDHTKNPPPYFEGMKSFGESENKIEVLSDNNLQGELNQSSKATLMYRNSSNELVPIPILRGKWDGDRFLWGDEILEHDDGNIYFHKRCFVKVFDGTETFSLDEGRSTGNTNYFRSWTNFSAIASNSATNHFINNRFPQVTADANWAVKYDYINIDVNNNNQVDSKISIRYDKSIASDADKFRALLKQWYDSGSPLTVIMQLKKEEVYPCELSEQLYSYDGETNIFIGGDVVGETVIEIGTKLGPIVDSIRQEARRTTNALEGLVAHGVQECAYQLYPEDFEKAPSVIEGEENA